MANNERHECRFCGNSFKSPNTLSVHVCVKKRRHMDSESPGPRMGFRVFQRFFALTTKSKVPKSLDDFINSAYYIDFVKFGHYLIHLKPIVINEFIDYVIKNSIKLKDWTKEAVYDAYIDALVKTEPAENAVERSIVTIAEWTAKNNCPMDEFFKKATANEIAFLVRRGRLSPWVLYLAASADDVMESFNEDHVKLIGSLIDSCVWQKRFRNNKDDVEFIASVLEAAGL